MSTHLVDRLWPDPATDVSLEESLSGFAPPSPRAGRPGVAVNMVTSIDGRAQRAGTAEGLAGRGDRHLLRQYRAAFDAVLSGVGTLRQAGLWLRVGEELAAQRRASGRPPNPVGVVVAGCSAVPTDAAWFGGDEPRILMVGAGSPLEAAPAGTELLRAPTERPSPEWVLERLAERGIGSVLIEGGPHLNAPFFARRLVDELYWTIGARLVLGDALTMIARLPGGELAHPHAATLLSVVRHGDELFLRYRLDSNSTPAASIGR